MAPVTKPAAQLTVRPRPGGVAARRIVAEGAHGSVHQADRRTGRCAEVEFLGSRRDPANCNVGVGCWAEYQTATPTLELRFGRWFQGRSPADLCCGWTRSV